MIVVRYCSIYAGLLHYVEELLIVDLTVAVLVELVDHCLKFVIAEVFAQLARHASQVAETDLASVVLIEQLEGLEDLFNWVALSDFGSHDLEEVMVLNLTCTLAVVLLHQVEDLLLLDIKAQSAHCYLQLVVVNSAGLISVEEIECFLDFLLLLF